VPVNIKQGANKSSKGAKSQQPRILALAARLDTSADTEQELQDLRDAVEDGNGYWDVIEHPKATVATFRSALRKVKSRQVSVIHFCGHGAGDGFVWPDGAGSPLDGPSRLDDTGPLDPVLFLVLMQEHLKGSDPPPPLLVLGGHAASLTPY
jgi:hypothetical protein